LRRTTSLNPEPWPWPDHPRILVENPDDAAGLQLATVLRDAGYGVAVCPGPAAHERCPLAGPEGCTIAQGADAVVFGLGLERAETREVLQALRARAPHLPIVVETTRAEEELWPELLRGCEVVRPWGPPEQLVSAVHRALERTA